MNYGLRRVHIGLTFATHRIQSIVTWSNIKWVCEHRRRNAYVDVFVCDKTYVVHKSRFVFGQIHSAAQSGSLNWNIQWALNFHHQEKVSVCSLWSNLDFILNLSFLFLLLLLVSTPHTYIAFFFYIHTALQRFSFLLLFVSNWYLSLTFDSFQTVATPVQGMPSPIFFISPSNRGNIEWQVSPIDVKILPSSTHSDQRKTAASCPYASRVTWIGVTRAFQSMLSNR